MGKLGPLTSQALGRSPYDGVVQGEGASDPRVPTQQYDDRGRPINPETKRINKDIIRSHNEVMLVIGVAEPENNAAEAQAETNRQHGQWEDRIGRRLLGLGRALEVGGVWGINGLRQRILLYKRYASIPLMDIVRFERSQRSVSSFVFAGMPSFLVGHFLKQAPFSFDLLQRSFWMRAAVDYVRIHMYLFVFMQRCDLISPTKWLPGPSYFIPLTASSPIPPLPPLPPLTGLTVRSGLAWFGALAVNVAPFVAYMVYDKVWGFITKSIWVNLYSRIPSPTNRISRLNILGDPNAAHLQHRQSPSRAAAPAQEDVPTLAALEGQATPHVPVEAVRRQSTFSARGDDYNTDDEEHDVLNATLISFDVEASEATDTPPGVWSAELRPNAMMDPRGQTKEEPLYRDNALTQMPSIMASDILTAAIAPQLVAPLEAFSLRWIARSFQRRRGLPMGDLYGLNPFGDLSMRGLVNFVGIGILHLILEGEVWASMTGLSAWFRATDEEWLEMQGMHDPTEVDLD